MDIRSHWSRHWSLHWSHPFFRTPPPCPPYPSPLPAYPTLHPRLAPPPLPLSPQPLMPPLCSVSLHSHPSPFAGLDSTALHWRTTSQRHAHESTTPPVPPDITAAGDRFPPSAEELPVGVDICFNLAIGAVLTLIGHWLFSRPMLFLFLRWFFIWLSVRHGRKCARRLCRRHHCKLRILCFLLHRITLEPARREHAHMLAHAIHLSCLFGLLCGLQDLLPRCGGPGIWQSVAQVTVKSVSEECCAYIVA